jgi:hypothetical protein
MRDNPLIIAMCITTLIPLGVYAVIMWLDRRAEKLTADREASASRGNSSLTRAAPQSWRGASAGRGDA